MFEPRSGGLRGAARPGTVAGRPRAPAPRRQPAAECVGLRPAAPPAWWPTPAQPARLGPARLGPAPLGPAPLGPAPLGPAL